MGNRLARFLSYALHPMLMPTFGFITLLFSKSYVAYGIVGKGKSLLIALILILTFVLPTLIILLLKKTKIISSIELGKREERTYPFLIVAGFYYLTYRLFLNYQLPVAFYTVLLSSAFVVIITLLINFFWKISAHLMGIGSFIGALLALNFNYGIDYLNLIIIFILLAGLLGYSRLKLEAHSPSQIYTGFSVGFVISFILFLIR